MEKILRNALPPQPGMATFARLEQVVIRGGMRELYVFRPVPERKAVLPLHNKENPEPLA